VKGSGAPVSVSGLCRVLMLCRRRLLTPSRPRETTPLNPPKNPTNSPPPRPAPPRPPPHLVQLLHHLRLLLLPAVPHPEPLLELLRAAEDLGQQEVEQRPELVEVVLEGGAGDEQAVVGAEDADYLRGGSGWVVGWGWC